MTGWLTLREMAFVEEEGFMIIEEGWYDFKRQKQKDEECILFYSQNKGKNYCEQKST